MTNAELVADVMCKRLGRRPYAHEVDVVAAVLAALEQWNAESLPRLTAAALEQWIAERRELMP